ncbi:MAG: hypothetical protein ACRDZX_08075 [Acidimicrobiales bacterium]
MRTLVVEDCRPLADLVAEGLTGQGIATDVAYEGAGKLAGNSYDVVVLDRALPGAPGADRLCQVINQANGGTRVLMSARAPLPPRGAG